MKVEIIKSGINGEGIGYIDKKPVFIPNALVGEVVEVTIKEKMGSYMIAQIEKILKKSPQRVTPFCECYRTCKACTLMHANYQEQCHMKEENLKQALRKYANVNSKLVQNILPSREEFYYRNSCKIPFKMENKKLVCGMYQPNSNYFIPITTCVIHEKEVERVKKEILKILNEEHLQSYDIHTKQGMRTLVIRHIQGKIQVTLVTGEDTLSEIVIQKIMQIEGVISLFQSIHTQKKSADVFGNKMILLAGERYLDFSLFDVNLKLSPRSFFQLNTKSAYTLYDYVKSLVGKVDLLVECYCGIGGISFALKDQAKRIIGIESVKDAVINANMSAKENHLDHMQFICDDAAHKLEYISKKEKIDCLVVDPPRTGLDDNMIQTLLRSKIKKIVYISCNPATLGKNLAQLNQRYKVEIIQPLDMFPQSAHVETVVLMSKKNS